MIKKNSSGLQTTRMSAEYFTGGVWTTELVKNEGLACHVLKVTFEPGARNHWHTHPVGQILLAIEGKGYVQKNGEPIKLLLPGDVVTVLPNEEHWHGATPDSIFTHIAINLVSATDEEVTWLSPVTDAAYSAPLRGGTND